MDEVALDQIAGATVADVMMRRPKTLSADATVADARAVFANPKVQSVPLVGDGGGLVGELARTQLPEGRDGDPAQVHASTTPDVIAPDRPVEEALQRLRDSGSERLAVVGDDGRLLGLLCLNGRHSAFCTDARR